MILPPTSLNCHVHKVVDRAVLDFKIPCYRSETPASHPISLFTNEGRAEAAVD